MENKNKVLLLRTCKANLTSHNGFQWPAKGLAQAPDWDPKAECGNGLHGLLWGEGDGSLLDWSLDAKWLVIEAEASQIVNLEGKVKVPQANVVLVGDQKTATDYLLANGGAGRAIVGASVQVGHRAMVQVGERGTATAGNGGTATAGEYGTATAGNGGTATAGYGGTATAGNGGTATAGYGGTATAGNGGTATAGEYGTATAGNGGTATAGYGGTATAGNGGTATAGNGGTATAGNGGTATAGIQGTATAGIQGTATAGIQGTATAGSHGRIQLEYWDSPNNRYRLKVFYVGENGVKANQKYRLDDRGEPIEA